MLKRLLCKVFGHKWIYYLTAALCQNCNEEYFFFPKYEPPKDDKNHKFKMTNEDKKTCFAVAFLIIATLIFISLAVVIFKNFVDCAGVAIHQEKCAPWR